MYSSQIVSCGPDGGSKFYVHRVVLGLQSKFFKSHACRDVVEVRDVSPECMAVLVGISIDSGQFLGHLWCHFWGQFSGHF